MGLPGYEAQRALDMSWAFSTKKQSDYVTALEDGDLTLTHPITDPSVAEISKELRTDRDTYGKGHEFPTTVRQVAQSTSFTRGMDGSSLILGWLFAFAMGKVTTIQPDSGGHPNTYLHTFSFFDPATEGTAVMPTTSIVEKVSTGIKRLIPSLAITSVSLTAEGFEHISASANFIGSGVVSSSTLSMPSMPTLSYLASNYATIKLGDAAEDISTRVRSWGVELNNAPAEGRGYFPGSGLYRGRLEVGARSIVPSLVVDLDASSDLYTDFLNNTELALEIYARGDLTSDGDYYHYLRLRFPRLYYSALPISEADGVFTYGVTFSEETVVYKSSDTPNPLVTVEVQNEQESYLVAAT